MSETKESSAGNAFCETLLFLSEASYAILPRDVAHRLGELKKNFWSSVIWLVDKEIEWIDKSVAGGDRLREEWRRTVNRERQGDTSGGGGI